MRYGAHSLPRSASRQFRFCHLQYLFTMQPVIQLSLGRQRDDDGYSHNDIPDLVQNK